MSIEIKKKGNAIFVLFIICCCWTGHSYGQGNPMFRKNQTRAVIVGISDYQNISDLDFAHRDAQALADYLQSPAGGLVPEENIRLLLNEKATQMQFAMALDWLQEESESGDRAYIYFSGHGDVEKKTARQRGFLLTYDAPNTTYMAGGAFPILFLQDIVNVLSSDKNVEVILLADACRAGNLAGNSIGGNHVTAEKLAEAYANEIKILSCQKDELSQEGQQWGEGRGVFSYHLIEGMIGLADASGDAEVSLREIRNYLENLVGEETAGSQYPLVIGDLSHVLARVNPESLAQLKKAKSGERMNGLVAMKSRGGKPDPDTLVWQQYLAFQQALKQKQFLYPKKGAAYTIYEKIKGEKIIQPYREEMKRDLAVALHDEAQQAINEYLRASPQELLKRWSYDVGYEHYPEYLGVAAELLGPGHFMYEDLRIRQLYFEGLELRLQAEKNKEKALFRQALEKQNTVLEMDSSAAYAYNEIGLLLRRLNREAEATAFFDKANDYSPNWVLPMANQVANFAELGKLETARAVARKALAIDSSFALLYHNLGYSYEAGEEWDKAIPAYEKAISLNPDFTDTYYNLGLVHYFKNELDKTQDYFLQYAEKLKEPQAAIWSDLGFIADLQSQTDEAEQYLRKALSIDPAYANAHYNLGELYLKQGKLEPARKSIRKYIELNPAEGDGYYLLAAILLKNGAVSKALETLQVATDKGFRDIEQMEKDRYFESQWETRAFKNILNAMRK